MDSQKKVLNVKRACHISSNELEISLNELEISSNVLEISLKKCN